MRFNLGSRVLWLAEEPSLILAETVSRQDPSTDAGSSLRNFRLDTDRRKGPTDAHAIPEIDFKWTRRGVYDLRTNTT